ncbi:hypothetical protein [Lactiplantibacillus plantarum]|uniref:hypothetical protein n=1 Tax=Lactiplantibacillus plantarum TaxID=1590 RepID=UPI0007A5D5D4|nr:hypothetical protein [Lactiplantibacillus plantarum]AMX10921.1 hypothetical protein A1F92_10265 [Lactiplantibacillus plantarum]AUS71693.1 hypothetical protein C1T23_00989 [Lactiplantibacillus plantarum]MCG0689685.1 hypothetical protein [Lactiplantibacillus plantarum]MCG0940841.1 hypothetical protein [Lactiplantibacillus plantarum]MDH5112624.1 hypothetical protein [Lactiplantibacillus plantarum]
MTAFVIYYWYKTKEADNILNEFVCMCKQLNLNYIGVGNNAIAIDYHNLLSVSDDNFSQFLVEHYIRRVIFTTNKYIELISEFSLDNYELVDIYYGPADDDLEAEYQFQSLIESNDMIEIIESIKYVKLELEYDIQRLTYREPNSKLKIFIDRRGLVTFESGTESIEISKTLRALVCGSAACD